MEHERDVSAPSADMPMRSTNISASSRAKTDRVLACVLCQQRKVKCDRKFPCATCVKSQAKCTPAYMLAPRLRRRRFPERELLDRLRNYESLLRRNNIKFEPLHNASLATEEEPGNIRNDVSDDFAIAKQNEETSRPDRSSSASIAGKSETVYKAKNLWSAMYQKTQDSDNDDSGSSPDELREAVVNEAWNQWHQSNNDLLQCNDHLMLGLRKTVVDLIVFHPDQGQIFRLWQLYLDNVNPVLKVTHTPTLQARVIDAASNLASVKPPLTALMFSIYCVSIMSIEEDACIASFGLPKEHLLTRYQFGCHQALLNSGFLRSNDREDLTAFYLYLISIRPSTDPQSLSSLLGLAIRIAQRMELHNESANAKYTPFETEMRRRLWWSLILFDTRVCEMSDFKNVMLIPTWDCKPPLNINDFDMQPEMSEAPMVQGHSTEALFAVTRSEMADFIRHRAFYLDFTNPALKTIAKDLSRGSVVEGDDLDALEKLIDEKYLKFCIRENPLHFMTIWTARGYLAKNRLLETYSKYSPLTTHQTEMQRGVANSHALAMLECDTNLMTSPLIKKYLWFIQYHFPFPAHMHLLQDLRMHPIGEHTEYCWEILSAAYDARIKPSGSKDDPFFRILAKIVLQAWEAREAVLGQAEKLLVPPPIILDVRSKLAQSTKNSKNDNPDQSTDTMGIVVENTVMPVSMGIAGHNTTHHDLNGQRYNRLWMGQGQASLDGLDLDSSQLDWNTMDWDPMHSYRH